jgi:hypothetical protein
MDFVREFFIFAWAVINNWAGYCTGGVVVALLWFWSTLKQQPIPKKLGLIVAAVFFALAIFSAWREQYHRAQEAEARGPRLVGEIQGTLVGISEGQVGMIMVATISNLPTGDPSIVKMYSLTITLQSGEQIKGEPFTVPKTMTFDTPSGRMA